MPKREANSWKSPSKDTPSATAPAPSVRFWSWRHDLAVAAVICVLTWVMLGLTAADIGLTYDEPIYMSRADLAALWLGLLITDPGAALSHPAIDRYWSGKDAHPGFMKLTTAVTSRIVVALHLLPGWALPLTWMRTGTMFWFGLALAVMYLLLRAVSVGRAACLFAPGAVLFMPRVFAHAHLGALDAPALAMSFLAVAAAWWAAERRDRLSLVIAGLALGAAIGTKVNGFFVPLVTLPYALFVNRKRSVRLLISYAVFAPAVFFLTWPWLWHDTWTRLTEFLAFHWHHWEIGVMYFGRIYTLAPWHYPLVMTAITTPLFTLILALGGLGGWLHLAGRLRDLKALGGRPLDRLWLLAGLALIVNIVPNMLPSTPKYGGVRLFLPAMAWLGVLAALALERIVRRLRVAVPVASERGWMISVLVVTLALLPSVAEVGHFHPYCLSAYNGLIGGLPGAAKAGMEPTYWGDTYLAAAYWLTHNAPPGAIVWIEPQGMESVVRMYKYLGPLRRDLQTTAGEATFAMADFVVSQNKPTEFTDKVRRLVETKKPIWTEGIDGVPLIFVWHMRSEQDDNGVN